MKFGEIPKTYEAAKTFIEKWQNRSSESSTPAKSNRTLRFGNKYTRTVKRFSLEDYKCTDAQMAQFKLKSREPRNQIANEEYLSEMKNKNKKKSFRDTRKRYKTSVGARKRAQSRCRDKQLNRRRPRKR